MKRCESFPPNIHFDIKTTDTLMKLANKGAVDAVLYGASLGYSMSDVGALITRNYCFKPVPLSRKK